MGTNKRGLKVESLEVELGGLQNNFSHMETGVIDKLHHLEGVLSKLSEILMAYRTTSDENASDPISSSSNG